MIRRLPLHTTPVWMVAAAALLVAAAVAWPSVRSITLSRSAGVSDFVQDSSLPEPVRVQVLKTLHRGW